MIFKGPCPGRIIPGAWEFEIKKIASAYWHFILPDHSRRNVRHQSIADETHQTLLKLKF